MVTPSYAPLSRTKTVTIDSTSSEVLIESSATEILKELNNKRRMIAFAPIAFGIGIAAVSACLMAKSVPLAIGSAFIFILAGICLLFFDKNRKETLLNYNLHPKIERAFQNLSDAFRAMAECGKVSHIKSFTSGVDPRYSAGADSLVERYQIRIGPNVPKNIATNTSPVAVPAGEQLLYFFPDYLYIYDSKGIGAIAYETLKIETDTSRFVEARGAPYDAQVIDRTWQYTRKDGGPDRRFVNNQEFPVVLYEYIHFSSPKGLSELFQVSRIGIGDQIKNALDAYLQTLAEISQTVAVNGREHSLYLFYNGQQFGPSSLSDIRSGIDSGLIPKDAYFWDDTSSEWKNIERLGEMEARIDYQ